jgi:hypothetical protein
MVDQMVDYLAVLMVDLMVVQMVDLLADLKAVL